MTKFLSVLLFSVVVSGCAGNPVHSETANYEYNTAMIADYRSDTKPKLVPYETYFPKNITGKLPVIVVQHGSLQSENFSNGSGRTDRYSKEIVKQGLKNGFAVVVIDAFYKRNFHAGYDKDKFPDASKFALEIKKRIESDGRFDKDRMFYTGYSYGGVMVLQMLKPHYQGNLTQWRAMSSVVPGCHLWPDAEKNLTTPNIQFVLGEKDYQAPAVSCEMLAKWMTGRGFNVELHVLKNTSHSLSTHGDRHMSNGISWRGCQTNPVIAYVNKSWEHIDGTVTNPFNLAKTCKTNGTEGGGPMNRIEETVSLVVNYFSKYK